MQHLRLAIERARAEAAPARPGVSASATGAWEALPQLALDPDLLAREGVVTWSRSDPAHRAFDLLRSRLVHLARERGWRRIGIAAPDFGCGASVVAANLALGLARRTSRRALLMDLHPGRPGLARCLGQEDGCGDLAAWLAGGTQLAAPFLRLGANLALGLAAGACEDGVDRLEAVQRNGRLDAIAAALAAEVTLCDLAPLLASDEGAAALPLVDAVLLVAEAGRTTAAEIEACRRLLGEETGFAGVVLNRCGGRGRRGG